MKMPEGAHHHRDQSQSAPVCGAGHHAHMAAEFKKRFWISVGLTLPILFLSPMLQALVGRLDRIDACWRRRPISSRT